MLILRKAEDRGQTTTSWLKSYHSFSFNDYFDRHWHHFHDLRVINEDIVAPKQGFGMHPHANMEILTYIISGALSHQDSLGHQFKISAGDWQRMSAGTGIAHSEWNHENEPCHLLQIWIRPNIQDLEPSYEQKAFLPILDTWQTIVSPNKTADALLIHQNSQLLRYISSKETTIQLNLKHKPHYLQVIRGFLTLNQEALQASDAMAIENESEVVLELAPDSEIILFSFA